MMTFQGMIMRTEYMMEQIRMQAIDATYKKWEQATYRYYRDGFDDGETTRLYKELERLGANMEYLFDRDLEIREMASQF